MELLDALSLLPVDINILTVSSSSILICTKWSFSVKLLLKQEITTV